MMAVKYHGCTCYQRYCNSRDLAKSEESEKSGNESDSNKSSQQWYLQFVASTVLVMHGFSFLIPTDSVTDRRVLSALGGITNIFGNVGDGSIDMPATTPLISLKTLSLLLGYDLEWTVCFVPYMQGLAAVFNISLGLVSWWTRKESSRYNRLIQMRVFAFCVNLLHAYITGPILYSQDQDISMLAPSRIIGYCRLSYLTPGLLASGMIDIMVENDQDKKEDKEK